MTLRELLRWGEERLEQAGVPEVRTDAWELLEFSLGIEKSYYFMHENDKIKDEQQNAYHKVLLQREQRIPLQHIIGSAWFMGYEFYVNENVLTPRFDTEILVDQVSKWIKPGMQILDMCTGSGCILLSLLKMFQQDNVKGLGVDISPKALEVAEKNKERLGVTAEFAESDLYSNVKGVYDIIVSNPPYIPTKELKDLMPEVRDHEPWLALDGKEDGLYFYRKIVAQAENYLKPEGWLCLEIGYDQGEALRQMLKEAGYDKVQIVKDLAGLDRVAFGQKENKMREDNACLIN